MVDPAEHQLVLKAFELARNGRSYVTGYVEWDAKQALVAREKLADLDGLTPEAVRTMAIDFVTGGGLVVQRAETREEHLDFRFMYKFVLPVPGFPCGVFVELRLIDDDPDSPTVHIVGAHKQGV